MSDPSRRSGLGGVPWGLLGMLVAVVLVESAVRRHALDLSNPLPLNWAYSKTAAGRAGPDRAILCFGTSLVKNGVLPRVVEARTGRRTLNLAVCNGPTASSYFLLRRALAAGAAPRAVLIDCQDEPIARGSHAAPPDCLRINLRQWPELIGLSDGLDLARTARDPGFLTELLLARLLPTYHARWEIRQAVLSVLGGEDGSTRETMLMLLRNWVRNEGAQVLPRNAEARDVEPPPALSADEFVPADDLSTRWESHPLSASYASRFLDLAAARGIVVFWLLPPLGPEHQARRAAQGQDAYSTRQARAIQTRYPGVIVIDGRHSGYDRGVFWDGVHLDRQGAVTYSTDLAAILADVLDEPGRSPRWNTLPTYRPLATDQPVEDLVESRLAVRAEREGRRQ